MFLKTMKVRIFLLGLLCLSLLFNGVHLIDPTEQRFKNDHVVTLQEFKKLGADPAKWDALSQQRGTGHKSTNTFIVTKSYNENILPSLRSGGILPPDEKGDNLWKSRTGFKQVEIKRDNQGAISGFSISNNKPITVAMNADPRTGQRVPVHYEGFASNTHKVNLAGRTGGIQSIVTTVNADKNPKTFLASDKNAPNPRVSVTNSGKDNIDAFFKTKEAKTYRRTLPTYTSPISKSSNVQNPGNIGAPSTSSSSRSALGTSGITRPTFQRSSQNNPTLSQTQLHNRRGSTGQILPSSSGTTGSRLNNLSGSNALNRPAPQTLSNSPGRSRSNSMSLPSSSSLGFRRGRSNSFSNQK